jgi:hypothetical protein
MTTHLLDNGKVVLALRDRAAASGLVADLLAFLAPFFRPAPSDAIPDLVFSLDAYDDLPAGWQERCTQEVCIRASTAADFNLRGLGGADGQGHRIVVDAAHRTAYRFLGEREAEVYTSAASRIHLYELVRYTCLLLEEARGTALLHASAALSPRGGAYVALGAKGAGKTSTLYHLLFDHGLVMLAGDKVLLSVEDGLPLVRGWPDFPHVGIGTLERHPGVARRLGVSLLDESGAARRSTDKELIAPERLREVAPLAPGGRAHRVEALIFPHVDGAGAEARLLPEAEKSLAFLVAQLEHPHEFGVVRWHALASDVRVRERLDHGPTLACLMAVPWIEVRGPVSLGAELLGDACANPEIAA